MIGPVHPLLLGSASPRRREILAGLGFPLVVRAATIDETPLPGEEATAYLQRIVSAKLASVAMTPDAEQAGAILTADTSVLLEDRILGKPRDLREATEMLTALSGQTHVVATCFGVAGPEGRLRHLETVTTQVSFRPLDAEEIELYAATREGLDKAGAYAIQGIGAFAVARIEGSYSNVVGLPACEVVQALRRSGLLERFPFPTDAG